ncbi:hypothetical protein MBANPS3_007569 [Mucor bainieri]
MSFATYPAAFPRSALANLHVLIDGTIRTDAPTEGDGWEAAEEMHELLTRRDFKTHDCCKDLLMLPTIYCQDQIGGIAHNAEYRALVWPRTSHNPDVPLY